MFLLPILVSPDSAVQDVFVSSVLDRRQKFPIYRIPALCQTRKGTLLAFAEGRGSFTDQSENQLVLRRLPRGGKNWSEMTTVRSEAPDCLNNPCVLPTREGRVWLMYQRYPKGLNALTCVPGLDVTRCCTSYVTYSDDDGLSWSNPQDISASIKGDDIRSVASGPGVGIELHSGPHRGRLLFPFNEGTGSDYNVFSVFSDDHGRTWRRGPSAFRVTGTRPNENQVAEADGGIVYLNCRNEAQGHYRLTSASTDGGETWDLVQPRLDLPDPICMGSTIAFRRSPTVLAFCNCDTSTSDRVNGTVRLSFDNGQTWPVSAPIVPNGFGYSSLCSIDDHHLGLLYEQIETNAQGKPGMKIKFRTIDVKD